jgi:ATP-dependent helicase/nuclease subunit A
VPLLRRRLLDETEVEGRTLFKFQIERSKPRMQDFDERSSARLSFAEIGIAHHNFLRLVSLERTRTLAELELEARRMQEEGTLSPAEGSHLDLAALAAFWQSDTGTEIRSRAEQVRRELPFTARFSPEELTRTNTKESGSLEGEFVVVQGIADLVVLLPEEIWLVDFKTDQFEKSALADKVKLYEPQLRLYAMALGRVYLRPVNRLQLYFLTLRRTVQLDQDGTKSDVARSF